MLPYGDLIFFKLEICTHFQKEGWKAAAPLSKISFIFMRAAKEESGSNFLPFDMKTMQNRFGNFIAYINHVM